MIDKPMDTRIPDQPPKPRWARIATWVVLLTAGTLGVLAALYPIILLIKLIVEVCIAISHL